MCVIKGESPLEGDCESIRGQRDGSKAFLDVPQETAPPLLGAFVPAGMPGYFKVAHWSHRTLQTLQLKLFERAGALWSLSKLNEGGCFVLPCLVILSLLCGVEIVAKMSGGRLGMGDQCHD